MKEIICKHCNWEGDFMQLLSEYEAIGSIQQRTGTNLCPNCRKRVPTCSNGAYLHDLPAKSDPALRLLKHKQEQQLAQFQKEVEPHYHFIHQYLMMAPAQPRVVNLHDGTITEMPITDVDYLKAEEEIKKIKKKYPNLFLNDES